MRGSLRATRWMASAASSRCMRLPAKSLGNLVSQGNGASATVCATFLSGVWLGGR
jgi:hypothetical protein